MHQRIFEYDRDDDDKVETPDLTSHVQEFVVGSWWALHHLTNDIGALGLLVEWI